MSESPGCCRWCVGFIFSSGLTALFMWLSLRPSKPTYSIEQFYVPALNKTANDTRNTTITFDFKLNNGKNKDKGIYYDTLNLTLYYGGNLSFPIATDSIDGFYQGHKKKAHRYRTVKAVGDFWETARKEVSDQKKAVFRVNLVTAVRYKIIFWKTKRHKMNLGANVTVNEEGKWPGKKGVKLSCAPVHYCYCAHVGFLLLSILFLI